MINKNHIEWLNNSTISSIIPMPEKLSSIPIVYAFPGATSDCLDTYLNFKGVIVVSYGSGNVSDQMYYAIKKLTDNKVKVVLTTNCRYGGVASGIINY
jgi:L-asparaginase/Glu-tRNA(Gln) amidotransferase subunit D